MNKRSLLTLTGMILASSSVYADATWTPISFEDYFDNAADTWIRPPNGESVPRQGWLNTLDGFFTREWHLSGSYKKDSQDTYTGVFQYQTPLSRRFWVGADVPFVVNKGNQTDFGDVGLTVKTMLHETRNLSISGGLGARFATGDKATGGATWNLFPHVAVWSDVGSGWSLRGGVGLDIQPETNFKPHYIFNSNFAVGQTITPHDAILGDFTYYVATNVKVPIDDANQLNTSVIPQTPGERGQTGGSSLNNTTVSITPGIRTHIANNTFLVTGVEIPLTGPDSFDYQATVLLVKGF